MPPRSLLTAPFMLVLIASVPAPAYADTCDARIEHTGNAIQGSRVYSNWRIGHTPWRWATVSFRYQLTYIDENNEEARVDGRFREHISGREDTYVKLKNLRSRPTHVTQTKITDIACDR